MTEATEAVEIETAVNDVAAEQVDEQANEQVDETNENEPEKKPDEAEEAKRHASRAQRRIDKLTREKYELKGRLEALEKFAHERQGSQPADDAKPSRDQYSTEDDYIDALTDWKIDRKLGNAKQEIRAEEENTSRTSSFAQRENTIRKEVADYDDVIEDASDIQIPRAASEAIIASDVGPEIRYHIAKNPDIADKLMSMRPIDAAREIGKIEARIEADKDARKTAKKPITKAPDPIRPVHGVGSPKKDPSTMTPDEWAVHRGYKKP